MPSTRVRTPIPPTAGPVYRPARVRLVRGVCRLVVRTLFRLRVEGRERFATGPAIYCVNHLNWADPIVLLAALPAAAAPRDVRAPGGRHVDGRPQPADHLGRVRDPVPAGQDRPAARSPAGCERALGDGWVIVIMGEGRIHRGERELMPLADGTAFFALRAGVPDHPDRDQRHELARVPAHDPGPRRASRSTARAAQRSEAVAAMTERVAAALRGHDGRRTRTRRSPGRFGRWLTECFNDWPEGARPELGRGDAAAGRAGDAASASDRDLERPRHPADPG